MRIQDRTILVTGGGSGIGRGLAQALAARGARVIVAGRREAPLRETAQGHGMAVATFDAADPGSIRDLAARVTAEHPALDAVLHNAGIMQDEDLAAGEAELAKAEAIVATNLLGPMRLTAALMPHLLARPRAAVLTVTSGLAFVPLARTAAYSATKAGLHSWTQSLRSQLHGTSVEVIEIAPPMVATELQPGQSGNPHAMPLDAFVAETMEGLAAEPTPDEVLVGRVLPLRRAEAEGRFAAAFAMLNPQGGA